MPFLFEDMAEHLNTYQQLSINIQFSASSVVSATSLVASTGTIGSAAVGFKLNTGLPFYIEFTNPVNYSEPE